MPKVTVVNNSQEVVLDITQGEVLAKVLKSNDIDINFPCSANGKCGKCLVKVISGEAEPSPTDLKKLSDEKIAEGYRASCRLYVQGDLTVEVVN